MPGVGVHSSFTLHQFWCSAGYAMDNLDEIQRIHASRFAYISTVKLECAT